MYAEKTERTEYGTDYMRALSEWGKLDSDTASLKKAIEIIEKVEKLLGSIVLAYKIASNDYVAIKYANDPRSFVFVHKGFVDHRIDLDGSHVKSEEEVDVWRTYLPTKSSQTVKGKNAPELVHVTCSVCFIQYPQHLKRCPTCFAQD